MLATLTQTVMTATSLLARFDPEGEKCLADRQARPLWWAITQDLINTTDPGMACKDSIATQVGEAVWDSSFQPAIDDMKAGVADTTKTMATFWVSVPDPNVGDPTTGQASDAVAFLQSSLAPFVGMLLVAAVIIGCIRAMYDSRGQEWTEILKLLLRYVFISGLIIPITATSLIMVHEAAQWVLERSTLGTHFAENLFELFNSTVGVTSAIILAAILLMAALVAILQAGVMIFRGPIIILRLGTILLSVAVSNTEAGRESLRGSIGSLVAWIIYPFAAALVYATAFRLMGTDTNLAGNGLLQCIYGIAAMLMAIFALPATMRLVIPAVAPAAGGKGVGAAVAGAATTFVVMKSGRAAA